MNRFCSALLLVLFSCAIGQYSNAAVVWTSIDVPGSTLTAAFKINAAGHVVGYYSDSNNRYHGFLLQSNGFTTIDFPGAVDTYAYGINDQDEIVGSYIKNGGVVHGFRMEGSNFRTIDYPGAMITQAYGVNNAGVVVGTVRPQTGPGPVGFELIGDTYSVINPPGSLQTLVFDINNEGDVVGCTEFDGFVYDDGDFGPRIHMGQTEFTCAYGVNDPRQIVGSAIAERGLGRGFRYFHAAYVSIIYPGALATQASSINLNGDVVGVYEDTNLKQRGFLRTHGTD
ncbi:MAG TPA: hypothetical protein VH437_02605 [Terriglobales bacterium]|jgi:probable HAF family extracellular repeat protein